MTKMDKQTAFDIAVSGIIAQGGRSEGTNVVCAFRGKKGRKCAIGFLIKDEDYRPQFEIDGLRTVASAVDLGIDPLAADYWAFLRALQGLHDLPYSVAKWPLLDEEWDRVYLQGFRARAREFAKDWGLSAKVLDDKPLPKAITACLETELEPA
jgi:hypothetical protein